MKTTSKKKILILDDDPDITLVLAAMVEDEGYIAVTTTINNYMDYIYNEELPSIIILDMFLSGADGCEIARKLKEQKITQRIPLLMISAHPHAEQEAKDAGADDFLAKPFEIEEFLTKISLYLPAS